MKVQIFETVASFEMASILPKRFRADNPSLPCHPTPKTGLAGTLVRPHLAPGRVGYSFRASKDITRAREFVGVLTISYYRAVMTNAFRVPRRSFLRQAAAAGCGLALQGLRSPAAAASSAGRGLAEVAPGVTGLLAHPGGHPKTNPIILVTLSVNTDVNPRARTWSYIDEILRRAGLFFEPLPAGRLEELAERPPCIVVLAGHLPLTDRQCQALTAWVSRGGSLLGLGGTSGLEEVFGVKSQKPLAEGWLKVNAGDHPVTRGLRSSLHVFGGYTFTPGSATGLADAEAGNHIARSSAILENRFGKGRAMLLGPDLVFSIVHIQQGVSVLQDAKPPPDGSAAVNDGVLKAEDGLVLDWQRDRSPMAPDGGPIFLEPVSDELRELILRSVFHLAQQQRLLLPVLYYWPRALEGVGLISHDTDGNEPAKAPALLEVMRRCQVQSTWLLLYPGGYPRDFYGQLRRHGFEIGIHYDAMTGGPRTSWSKENFLFQHRWVRQTAGVERLYSNKNHYTRWEGRLDFWRWCEEAGLHSDQTRGPSKKGTIGFPLGGSQPYFPLDDEAASPRFLNVLEVNLLTQDLVVTCPPEYGPPLLDSAVRHHGVAHFLFHPAHILKPGVVEALTKLLDYGRTQRLEWWTNEQIYQWEILRREVTATFDTASGVTFRAPRPLSQATLLLLRPSPEARSITLNGQAVTSTRRNLHGFEFDALALDLAGQTRVQVG